MKSKRNNDRPSEIAYGDSREGLDPIGVTVHEWDRDPQGYYIGGWEV